MTDAFDEVEEGLRREKATELWNKLWPWLAVAIGAVIVAVSGWEVYKWQRNTAIEKDATVFATGLDALTANKPADAEKAFAQLAGGTGGYAVLAGSMLADPAVNPDRAKAAAALQTAATKDKGLLGRLQLLKLAYLKADTDNLADLTKRVQPLVDGGGAQSALARELLAAKALAGGDVERARRDFQQLQLDLDAPQALKQRVGQALLALPPKKGDAVPAAPLAAPPQTPAKPK